MSCSLILIKETNNKYWSLQNLNDHFLFPLSTYHNYKFASIYCLTGEMIYFSLNPLIGTLMNGDINLKNILYVSSCSIYILIFWGQEGKALKFWKPLCFYTIHTSIGHDSKFPIQRLYFFA